jgi:hypothetical protein
MHDPIAIRMATESTRRGITEPAREPRRRRAPRRTAARVLQAVAHRLDPYVAPRPHLGR